MENPQMTIEDLIMTILAASTVLLLAVALWVEYIHLAREARKLDKLDKDRP